MYLNTRLTPLSVDHRLWDKTLPELKGKTSVLNLNSTATGLSSGEFQSEFNTKEDVTNDEPLV